MQCRFDDTIFVLFSFILFLKGMLKREKIKNSFFNKHFQRGAESSTKIMLFDPGKQTFFSRMTILVQSEVRISVIFSIYYNIAPSFNGNLWFICCTTSFGTFQIVHECLRFQKLKLFSFHLFMYNTPRFEYKKKMLEMDHYSTFSISCTEND